MGGMLSQLTHLTDHAVDHKPVCCFGTSHQHLQLTVRLFRLKLMQRHTVSVAKPGQDVVDVIALAPPQVSSKIGVIETLINKVDKIILGGGMIFTFYKARGLAVGSSLVEEDKLELAKSLEAAAKKKVC